MNNFKLQEIISNAAASRRNPFFSERSEEKKDYRREKAAVLVFNFALCTLHF
jgi:hypothetical protein